MQIVVGDIAARDVDEDQPVKFAAMECVYKTGDDQPEKSGESAGRTETWSAISIPGLDSLLAGFSTGTEVQGLDSVPASDRPPVDADPPLLRRDGRHRHALTALAAWFAITWRRRRDLPSTPWFLRFAALAGVAAVTALESGWIVTEVGRQPWIVSGLMKTASAVTPAKGIWFAYGLTLTLYLALAVITVVVLRGLSRRWREIDARDLPEVRDVPYGPTGPPREVGMSRADAAARHSLGRRDALRVFGGADFGAGIWDLLAGGGTGGERPDADRPLDRAGLGGQPRLADLRARRALDRLPEGLLRGHDDPLHPLGAGGARESSCAGPALPSVTPYPARSASRPLACSGSLRC